MPKKASKSGKSSKRNVKVGKLSKSKALGKSDMKKVKGGSDLHNYRDALSTMKVKID